MAKAYIKTLWCARLGTQPSTIRFFFDSKTELKEWLSHYRNLTGSGVIIDLSKDVYSWNDSTKQMELTSVTLTAADLD